MRSLYRQQNMNFAGLQLHLMDENSMLLDETAALGG
jgi:hypothetical protein